MFYSHCLISRQGPLKPIWIAAYCQKKLKKEQVKETNISSSVDEIMLNEVTVTYRVLGYLLLGVVRIYSKKVEYLYHDCNDVLTKINTYVPSKKIKKGMCASYSSITLPEKFELDGFDLELPEDTSGGNIATNQQITLEETMEHAWNGQYSLDKFYQEEEFTRFEFNDCIHTPVRDALSPHSRDTYMEAHPADVPMNLEARTEEYQGHQLPREEFSDYGTSYRGDERMELGMQLNEVTRKGKRIQFLESTPPDPGTSGVVHKGDLLESTEDNPGHDPRLSDVPKAKQIKLTEIIPPDLRKGGADEPVELGMQLNEVGSKGKRIQFLEITPPEGDLLDTTDDTPCCDSRPSTDGQAKRINVLEITPRDARKCGITSDGDPLANTADIPHDLSIQNDTGAAIPELMVIRTPSKKEPPRFSRKRKHAFDDTIVLSNKAMKRNLNDSSDLVAKRRKVPLTALDVWKVYKLKDFFQDFMEPLIPGTTQLKALFYKRISASSLPFETTSGLNKSGQDSYDTYREPPEVRDCSYEAPEGPSRLEEDRYATHREPSEERAYSPEAVDILNTTAEDGYESHGEPSEIRVHSKKKTMDEPTRKSVETPTTSRADDGLSEIEAQDIGLNLTDEELHPCEDGHDKNHDKWSVRTRKVANFLHQSFLKKKERGDPEVLNLKPVLQGKTRKENARLFYEILVLKSFGFVDVKQEAPYDDIYLQSSPKLVATS